MAPGLSARLQLAQQSLTAFAGDEEAEFGTGTSDPSASGCSSALRVPMDFLPQGRLKPEISSWRLRSALLTALSVHLLEPGDSQGKHPALPKHSNTDCCYVAASSKPELRSLGPLQDVLVPALTLLVGLCLGGRETEIIGKA